MPNKTCSMEGCNSRTVGRGLCRHHYNQAHHKGTLPPRNQPTVPIEECLIDERTARIPLWGKGGEIRGWALIDRKNFETLNRWRWKLTAQGYAARTIKSGVMLMHRFIMGLEFGDNREADHRNLKKLDNREENLRVVTHDQNGQNLPERGKARGVHWDKKLKKWRAKAMLNGRMHHIGLFEDFESAAAAAKDWRRKHMPFAQN